MILTPAQTQTILNNVNARALFVPTQSVGMAQLVNSMTTREPVTVRGVRGVVNAIEAEDGSGKCFNVRLLTPRGEVTVFNRIG